MKKLTRVLSLLLACVLVIGVVGGCQKNNGSSEGKVSISIGNWPNPESDPEWYATMSKKVEQFNEIYPDIEIVPDEWSYDVQTFLPKAEGGTLPTLYQTHFTEAAKIMEFGYAADVTEQMKQYGYYDKLNEHLLETISENGNIYLIPYAVYTLGLMVNVNLFREAGLVDAEDKPMIPQTFEELAQTAKTITEKTGKAGFVFPTVENMGGWNFTALAWNFGTEFMEKQDGKWKAVFNSDEAVQSLQYLKDLKWKANAMPALTKLNAADIVKEVGTDQAAMAIANQGQLNDLVKAYGMDINSIAFAKMPGGPERHVTLMGGGLYAIAPNATPEQIGAVFKWLEFDGYTFNATEELKERKREEMKASYDRGDSIIGVKDLSIWNGKSELQSFYDELDEEFRNIPANHVESFNDKSGIDYRTEEPVAAQDLYAVLDRCIQEVLTNESADCKSVLDKAVSDFQSNTLDYEK